MNVKGKRIACFVALAHHTRFLWPITDALEKRGAKVIFFTVASDFPYEGDLIKKGKPYKLLQNYSRADTGEKIEKTTKAFFDLWEKRCFDWDGMRHWGFVTQNHLELHGFHEYFYLEEFIKTERPDMFMLLNERNRWGKLVGHQATKAGIPYVTFQEGDYYEDRLSFSGHCEYSTALLLWGKAARGRLVRAQASLDKMVLIGNTHLSTIKTRDFKKESIIHRKKELNIPLDKKVVLFLVGIQWAVAKEKEVWEDLLKGIGDDEGIVKLFKWHPKVGFASYKRNIEDYFKVRFPSCILLHNYDSYKLLPIADYCVTLGKTTLATEALSFGKPVFSIPGRDGTIDHYAQAGVAQRLWPPGNWEVLYDAIKNGVPQEVQAKVDTFLSEYFYKNNTVAVERALEVIDHVFESQKPTKKKLVMNKNRVPGRVSIILPSGADPEPLLATLTSLTQKVGFSDWGAILVVNSDNVRGVLQSLSGDVQVVEAQGEELSHLYNKGAEAASGEHLVFIRPGILYFKDPGLLEAFPNSVVGIPIKNSDMTPYCFGIGFDFNYTPYMMGESDNGAPRDAVGGGFLGVDREVFEALDGFDEGIANHLIDADLCLAAKQKGYSIHYLPEALAFHFTETFVPIREGEAEEAENAWRGRIRFFAKWVGQLPKNDNYLEFAEELLKN